MFNKAVVNIFGTILITLITSINLVVLARVLGPSVMGQYTYAIWLINISVIVATAGIPNTVYKYIPEINHKLGVDHGRFLFFVLFTISMILSVGVGLFIAYIFPLFKDTAGYGIYMDMIAIAIPLVVFSTLIIAYFKGRLKFSLVYILSGLYAIFLCAFTLIPAFVSRSIDPVLLGFLLTNILYFLFLILIGIRQVSMHRAWYYVVHVKQYLSDKKLYKSVGFRDIMLYIFSVSFILILDTVVWDRSEVFFLKHFADDAQVAYYSIDLSVVQKIISLLPAAIGGYLISYFALFNVKSSQKDMQQMLYNAGKLLIIVSVPIALCGAALASPLIKYGLGNTYIGAVGTLRVLFFFGFWGPISTPILFLLYGLKRIRVIMTLGIIFTIVTLILDYFFVRAYASIGGAIADSIVQFSFAMCLFGYLKVNLHKQYPYMVLVKTIIASIPVAVVLYLLVTHVTSFFSLLFAIGAGSIVYFIEIGYMRVFEKSDVSYLDKFFPNKLIKKMFYRVLRMGIEEFD